jgi:hypothetical protein
MISEDSLLGIRGAGALFVIGAALTWYGFTTALWGSTFLSVGILLLAGGTVAFGSLIRSFVGELRMHPPVLSIAAVPKITAQRCEYCRTKIVSSAIRCPSCGAPT